MKPPKTGKHKNKLAQITQTWGKTKFKPQKYVKREVPPEPQATAKPWQHVKNDMIDDSEDRGHQGVDSKEARKFMQQREQNHRRNIIEANRSEVTKWESFDEEQQSTSKNTKSRIKAKPSKEKSRLWQCNLKDGELPTAVEKFTFQERNFYRKKLTKGLSMSNNRSSLKSAIQDLKRNQELKEGRKWQKMGQNVNNPFLKKGYNK